MAAISPKKQFALHEFSVRHRVALAQRHLTQERSMDTVKDAVGNQYDQEMQAKRISSLGSTSYRSRTKISMEGKTGHFKPAIASPKMIYLQNGWFYYHPTQKGRGGLTALGLI